MAQAIIEGKTKWFKAIGEPRDNYNKDGREWSFQIAIGSAEKLLFRQQKVKKSIKFDEELGDYVTVNLPELNKKEKPNRKIRVVDSDGADWPEDKWVGNMSTIKATIEIEPYSFKNRDGDTISGAKLIPTKIEIVEHVPYVSASSKQDKPKRKDNTDWTNEDDE
jgi:hypothetical protein